MNASIAMSATTTMKVTELELPEELLFLQTVLEMSVQLSTISSSSLHLLHFLHTSHAWSGKQNDPCLHLHWVFWILVHFSGVSWSIRHLVHNKHFCSPLSCSVYLSNSHGSHTPFSEGVRQAFFTYVPAGQFRQQMLSCSYSMPSLQETSRLDLILMDPWAQARSNWLLAACMTFSNNKIKTIMYLIVVKSLCHFLRINRKTLMSHPTDSAPLCLAV